MNEQGEYSYLTFLQLAVAPMAVVRLVQRPQRRFHPLRISVAPYCARQFGFLGMMIGGMMIGKNWQHGHGATDATSCEHFPPLPLNRSGEDLAIFARLLGQKFDVCEMGMDLSLTIKNTSASHPFDFDAIVWGRYLDG